MGLAEFHGPTARPGFSHPAVAGRNRPKRSNRMSQRSVRAGRAGQSSARRGMPRSGAQGTDAPCRRESAHTRMRTNLCEPPPSPRTPPSAIRGLAIRRLGADLWFRGGSSVRVTIPSRKLPPGPVHRDRSANSLGFAPFGAYPLHVRWMPPHVFKLVVRSTKDSLT